MNFYGIEHRNTIETKPILISDSNTTFNFLYDLHMREVTSAEVRGYMNVNMSTVHAYKGRYGKGFVRTIPCYYNGKISKDYMTIEYWVEREEK